MDETVKKVKYVPFKAVEEMIKGYYWLCDWIKDELYQMAEKQGIDVVRYKQAISIGDTEMNAIKACTDWMTVEDYIKERMSSELDDNNTMAKHMKCIDKRYYPSMRMTEYRYDIMIGEIPKWQQKGEEDEQRN